MFFVYDLSSSVKPIGVDVQDLQSDRHNAMRGELPREILGVAFETAK
jgi:hypothetical protein